MREKFFMYRPCVATQQCQCLKEWNFIDEISILFQPYFSNVLFTSEFANALVRNKYYWGKKKKNQEGEREGERERKR